MALRVSRVVLFMAVAVNVIFVVLVAEGKLAPTSQPVRPGRCRSTSARWTDARSSGTAEPEVPVAAETVNYGTVFSVPPTA